MHIRHEDENGKTVITAFGSAKSITIGRDPSCDIVLHDEKSSRHHCEIRMWEDDYVVKDLKTPNGTSVNDEPIAVAELKPGDRITIGSTTLLVEDREDMSNTTAFREVEAEMKEGKGFRTILRRIVEDIPDDASPDSKDQ